MAERFERTGAALERHFQELSTGDGAVLLRHSYALTVGFWQTARGAVARFAARPAAIDDHAAALTRSSAQDLERALRALWKGTLTGDVSRAAKRAKARNSGAV
jgi:hypothetical protein